MQRRFDNILTSLEVPRPVMLAVSGGVDSMTMLDLFSRSTLNLKFAVAHCDFHLRGEESDADEALVRDWANAHGTEFHKIDFDTKAYAISKGVSVEMAARELRYRWFSEICSERGYSSLAVAHNSNDNAETMILNLLRGTGVKGLTGMKMKSPLPGNEGVTLIRPLLEFSRKEIYEYAATRGLVWREDSTNRDSSFKRNRVRNEIFPLFEKINPSFLTALSQDAERFSQVQSIADDFFFSVKEQVSKYDEDGHLRIDIQKLKGISHWDYVLFRLLSPFGFPPSAILDAAELLKNGGTVSGKTFNASEYAAVTTSSHVIVSPARVSVMAERNVEVTGPGEYSLNGVSFMVESASIESLEVMNGPSFRLRLSQGSVAFDSAALPFPFTVRNWQAGDWMKPLGMRGVKKLSDLFVDLKFPVTEKKEALVIAGEGSHVLALAGYRIDDSVKVTPSSGSVTLVHLI